MNSKNVDHLLYNLNPTLHPLPHYIVSGIKVPGGAAVVWRGHGQDDVTTVFTTKAESMDGQTWRMITLNVHSALDAVGFLAAVLPPLAHAGIPVNVYSGYLHDHLLVRASDCDRAVQILLDLSKEVERRLMD